jgi:hypothetical protein
MTPGRAAGRLYAPSSPSAVTAPFSLTVSASTATYNPAYSDIGSSFVDAQVDPSGYAREA